MGLFTEIKKLFTKFFKKQTAFRYKELSKEAKTFAKSEELARFENAITRLDWDKNIRRPNDTRLEEFLLKLESSNKFYSISGRIFNKDGKLMYNQYTGEKL